jgi:hypothetical protein
MYTLMVSAPPEMGLRAALKLNGLVFFAALKSDFHFGGALQMLSMFLILV